MIPTHLPKTWAYFTANLSPFECVPFDMLLEIFDLLQPNDLLVLARLNHTFRRLLMSRDSQPIWQRARQAMNPPCPDPPPLCSEPQWAHLLFGGRVCQVCNTKAYNWPDYSLGRRMCTPCARKSLVARGKVFKVFPECDLLVLNTIPYTNVDPSCKTTTTRFYWQNDIHNIMLKIEQFKNDIASGKDEALQAQNSWLEARSGFLLPSQEYLKKCSYWYIKHAQTLHSQHRKDLANRENQWIRKFTELGYQERDVRNMIWRDKVSLHGKVVNDAAWAKIRAKHETSVAKARTDRLRPLYRSALRKIYSKWFQMQPPQRWYHLPSFSLLVCHQTILDILKVAETAVDDPDAGYFADIVDRFEGICEAWRKDRLEYLRRLIATGIDHEAGELVNEDLAVFRCNECSSKTLLFGVGEAAIHSASSTCLGELELCGDIMTKVDYLVRLVGKEPLNTTPTELDILGKWFRCPSCMEQYDDKWRAFNWREMVEHCHPFTPGIPPMEVVTESSDLAAIKNAPSICTRCYRGDWICAHCSEFCYTHLPFEEVKKHVQEKHGVDEPIELKDFLWAFNHRRAWSHDGLIEVSRAHDLDKNEA